VNIETVTILLRVKNSTAFATDNKFDRKKNGGLRGHGMVEGLV
jgi:hypothetical protein